MSDIVLEITEVNTEMTLLIEEVTAPILIETNIGEKGDKGEDGAGAVPNGGTAGQILVKQSVTDGDAAWEDPAVATGDPGRVAYFDSNGELDSSDYYIDATVGSLQITKSLEFEDDGYQTFSYNRLEFRPTEDSASKAWAALHWDYQVDPDSSGFEFGTGGEAIIHNSVNFIHGGSGGLGAVTGTKYNLDIGSGDAFDFRGLGVNFVFGSIHDEVTLTGPLQGWIFQLGISEDVTIAAMNVYASIFADFANVEADWGASWNSFTSGPQFEKFLTGSNLNCFQANPSVEEFEGNAGLFCFTANPYVGDMGTGDLFGFNFNAQNGTQAHSAFGLYVTMDNVTAYAGVKATLTIEDVTFERLQPGQDGNSITIAYVDDGTAGSETVTALGNDITFHIEAGVTTATQIKAAADGSVQFASSFTTTITGNAGDTQSAHAAQNMTGGEWPGQKLAAYLDGDVEITGSLSFQGALSIGALNAYSQTAYANGAGAPSSVHSLISAKTIAANQSVTGADVIGINTACLITIGDNADVASAFLGTSALALPAVLSMGSGANIDRIAGATFALSLDAGATGGTVEILDLCRSLLLPNGVTNIDEMRGYAFDLPFGSAGVDKAWGVHITPDIPNYFRGSIVVGDATQREPSNASVSLECAGTDKAFLVPRMSETQRDALTPIDGMIIYNLTTAKFNGRAGSAWVDFH